ncbi:hypothetical protein AZOA_31820 [Azoarcus sp. Aa7]|nr:hypothetical protein [Azoarcus sp. Aa7]
MNTRFKTLLLLVLMLLAAGGAYGLRPTQKVADTAPSFDLEVMIPETFGDWRDEPLRTTQIVDPQKQQMIDKIYSKTLMRTYVNSDGNRVMLSIAYGSNQSDFMQVHKPEVCYPAQGFEIVANRKDVLQVSNGAIPVRRLVAAIGQHRSEPITYWTMIGNQSVQAGVDKKIAEMHFGLKGQIPDGLLFRVSSIDPDSEQAFDLQNKFVEELIGTLDPTVRLRISGLR